jgi:hypothetical protein
MTYFDQSNCRKEHIFPRCGRSPFSYSDWVRKYKVLAARDNSLEVIRDQ